MAGSSGFSLSASAQSFAKGDHFGPAILRMTRRYAHVASDPAKAAAASIAGKISGAMEKLAVHLDRMMFSMIPATKAAVA